MRVGFRALEMETEKGDSGEGRGSPERHRHGAPSTREAHGCQIGSARPDCCRSGSRTELTSSSSGRGRLLELPPPPLPQLSEDPSVPEGHCFVGFHPLLGKREHLTGSGLQGRRPGPLAEGRQQSLGVRGSLPGPALHTWLRAKLCRARALVPKARAGQFIVLLLPRELAQSQREAPGRAGSGTHNAPSVPVPELAGLWRPAHCTGGFQPGSAPRGFLREGLPADREGAVAPPAISSSASCLWAVSLVTPMP